MDVSALRSGILEHELFTGGSLEDVEGGCVGTAGSSGAGYSHLRMQSNLIGYIENESIQTLEDMMQKKFGEIQQGCI